MPKGALCILVSKFCFKSLSQRSLFSNCSYRKSFIAFSSRCTFFSFIAFHLICIFLFLACILLPLAHTYFIFFLFPHVFLCLWHIPISSFSLFRMYSFASGTYLFHLFLFPHVFLCFWHIPISSFFLFRMYSFASGTYLIHNSPLPRMYFTRCSSYISYTCIIFTN